MTRQRVHVDFTAAGVYRSKRLIARGAMGEVHLAEVCEAPVSDFPEIVAIKTFPSQMGFSSKSQRREIETMKQIKHPNVVELLDWGTAHSCYFLVVPYFSRGSLAQVLQSNGPLTPEEGLNVLHDMAHGLSAIHERGLLHLDIKPANILIGDDGRYVLSDLGIASFQFLERSSRVRGTPLFMAPEQARGESDLLDARTDLFALGTTLFYSLHDNTIIPGDSEDILAYRRVQGFNVGDWDLPEPNGFLSDIVKKLVAFEPHRRFGSAYELRAQIESRSVVLDGPGSGDSTEEKGAPVNQEWRTRLAHELGDPVLRQLLSGGGAYFKLRFFAKGEDLCVEDERSFEVFILLHGSIKILRKNRELATENRVGSIMGEVAALIGKRRTATLKATEDSVCALINGAELEQAARKIPALAVRIMKTLALHLHERDRKQSSSGGIATT